VREVAYPDSKGTYDVVKLEYALDGKLTKRTGQRHQENDGATVIEYGYDSIRRLTQQKATGLGPNIDDHVQSIGYGYDADTGRLTTITSYADNACQGTVRNQVKLEPNSLGMIDKEYQAHGGVVDDEAPDVSPYVAYRYDATAASNEYTKGMRLNRIEYPNGRRVHYTYGEGTDDLLSRVAAIKNDNGSGEAGTTTFAAYHYDGAGQILVEDYATAEVRLDLWGQTAGTYAGLDRFGRVKRQLWRDYGADANADEFRYGYDKNSNRLWKENVVSGELETPKHLDELYAYDKLNRLTAADRGHLNANKDAVTSTNFRQAWTLDDVGNWTAFKEDNNGDAPWVLEQTREHNKANEIADTDDPPDGDAIGQGAGQVAWDEPAHDAQGNMTQVPIPGDETHHHVCTYDAWNRLVKVQTDAEPAVTVAEYRYDGLHRRIAKLVPDGENWDRTDYYYTRSWQVIEERLATNVATANKDNVATAPTYQYIWSLRYIDACILRDENTDPESDDDCTDDGGSERIYYANGANMEVTAVLEADGDVTERYVYDPYGKVTIYETDWSDTVAWSASKKNELLYCGYRYDGETGLYHVRYRAYHATLGRWAQRDNEGYIEGLGLYENVLSRPALWIDRWGAEAKNTARPMTAREVQQHLEEARQDFRDASANFANAYELYLMDKEDDLAEEAADNAWDAVQDASKMQKWWNDRAGAWCDKADEGKRTGRLFSNVRITLSDKSPDKFDERVESVKLITETVQWPGGIPAKIAKAAAGSVGGQAAKAARGIPRLPGAGCFGYVREGASTAIESIQNVNARKPGSGWAGYVWAKIICFECKCSDREDPKGEKWHICEWEAEEPKWHGFLEEGFDDAWAEMNRANFTAESINRHIPHLINKVCQQ
jgi:RHS repeat-associated protein